MAITSRKVQAAYFPVVLCILAIGLPNLNLLMSIGSILLMLGWLLTGEFKLKFSRFLSNVPALLVTALFILHLFFLINTQNFDYAFHDLRIKLPLLILPLILSSLPPISRKQLRTIFIFFIVACLFATLRTYFNYFTLFDPVSGDPRDLVKGISHVRLSLMVVFAIAIIVWEIRKASTLKIAIGVGLIINFLIFLNLIRSATGFILIAVLAAYLLVWFAIKTKSKIILTGAISGVFIAFIIGGIFLNEYYDKYYTVSDAEELAYSKIGQGVYLQVENGNYVWQDFKQEEMEDAWNNRASTILEGKGQERAFLEARIMRYLTSLNLKKDSFGVAQLTNEDIRNIENGVSSAAHLNMGGLELRLNKLMFEWHNFKIGGNPSGNSLTQRFEHWWAALGLIQEKPLFGHGTGDVKDVFKEQYQKMETQLHPDYWFQSHNQFLTFFVSFGILGFIVFIASLLYPMFQVYYRGFLFLIFLIIVCLSCVTEDTLETQAGVTFFSFFYSLFINFSNRELSKD